MTYFDRLRIVNSALGGDWVFRLADAVGIELIRKNRPSWVAFYVEDCDRLHCPLDPGAPETEAYLGRDYSDMDMAFYAGMGFDGYRLALETPRLVDLDKKCINFDGRYHLQLPDPIRVDLDQLHATRRIAKERYYSDYGSALSVLFEIIDCLTSGDINEELLERVSAGCLILMCGGHRGCRKHITTEEEFQAQMESLIVFNCAKTVLLEQTKLDESVIPALHVVGQAHKCA